MSQKYLIGDVSKLLQLSADTLRYYDKLGIVSPRKDLNNRYRYYTVDDLCALTYVMTLRDLGLSLEEIKNIIHDHTLNDFLVLMERQEQVIEEKLKQLLNLKQTISDYKKHTLTATESFKTFNLCESPGFLYKYIPDAFDTSYSSTFNELNHHDGLSTPLFSAIFSVGRIFALPDHQNPEYAISCMVKGDDVVVDIEEAIFMKPSLCVHTVLSIDDSFAIEMEDLSVLSDYLDTHDLTPTGPLLARAIAFEHQNHEPIDYYEIWLPVAKNQ